MAAPNSVQFKVSLNRDGFPTEIRRFTIEKDVVTNYSYLRQKLYSIFPILQNSGMTIYWKDADNDMVTIGSDEELIIALTEMAGLCQKLTVSIPTPAGLPSGVGGRSNNVPQSSHDGVICDGCGNTVNGYRYKCLPCQDYDLCFDCEHKGVHSPHVMVRYPYPIGRDMHLHKKLKKLHKRFDHRASYVDHGNKGFKCGPKAPRCPAMSEDLLELLDDFVSTLTTHVVLTPEVLNQIIESLSNINLTDEEAQNDNPSDSNPSCQRKPGNAKKHKDGEGKNGDQERGGKKRGCSFAYREFPSSTAAGVESPFSIFSNVMQQVGEAAPHIVPNILNVLGQMTTPASEGSTAFPAAAPTATSSQMNVGNGSDTPQEAQPPAMEPMVVSVDDDAPVGAKTPIPGATTAAAAAAAAVAATPAPPSEPSDDFNKFIDRQLQSMLNMGFNNEGGWLRDALVGKNGDITKVLDHLSEIGKGVRLERLELD